MTATATPKQKKRKVILFDFVFGLVLTSCVRLRRGPLVGPKDPPTSFFSVNSPNVGISPQNFLTFSFNPFGTRQ